MAAVLDLRNTTYNREFIMAKILESMLKYQKKHNIKSKCMTNVQYYRDALYGMGVMCKIKPTIYITRRDTDNALCFDIHMTIKLNDILYIDPSFEFLSEEKIAIFHTINDFMKYCKNNDNIRPLNNKGQETSLYRSVQENHVFVLKNFINLVKVAEDINNNKLCITDKNYYNAQADYVENKMKNLKGTYINQMITSKARFEREL